MKYPLPPKHIGHKRVLTDINGIKLNFQIVDEIIQIQSDHPKKAIYLQKIQFEKDGRFQLRLAYYIIGKQPRMRNKWVFGQYATLLPSSDFKSLIKKAQRRGWISL